MSKFGDFSLKSNGGKDEQFQGDPNEGSENYTEHTLRMFRVEDVKTVLRGKENII